VSKKSHEKKQGEDKGDCQIKILLPTVTRGEERVGRANAGTTWGGQKRELKNAGLKITTRGEGAKLQSDVHEKKTLNESGGGDY